MKSNCSLPINNVAVIQFKAIAHRIKHFKKWTRQAHVGPSAPIKHHRCISLNPDLYWCCLQTVCAFGHIYRKMDNRHVLFHNHSFCLFCAKIPCTSKVPYASKGVQLWKRLVIELYTQYVSICPSYKRKACILALLNPSILF